MHFGSLDLTEYGAFDSCIKFPEGGISPLRTVEEYEIELYTEDQSTVSYLDGVEVPLKRGTLLCAKPGVRRRSRLPFRCLYLHITTEDAQLRQMLDTLPAHCVISDLSTAEVLFRRIISFDPEIFPEEILLLRSSVMELVYRFLQEVGSGRGDMLRAHRKTMQRVEQYIRQNPQEDLGLKALAFKANLSASYFHKLFTRHFGTSPAEYVLSCRISHAKALLVEAELSMEEIACQSGFSSQSYFNFCFKQQTGQTPLQYRKERLSRLMV